MTLRDFLAREFLGNPLGAWAIALGLLLGIFLALVFTRRLLVRRLERTAAHSATMLDDVALDGLRRTRNVFLFVLALTAASFALQIPAAQRTLIEKLAKLVFLLQAASWGSGAITFWIARLVRERTERDRASLATINLLGILARLVLFVLLFLLALQSFGINVTALITGLGIAGVAVALAVQNVLGDLLASLSIALDKPFVIGDFIVVDTMKGTVEEIGIKTTRVRSLSGEQLIFANSELLKARIANFGRMTERRVAFTLTVEYGTPPELVEGIPAMVREIVSAEPLTRFDRSHFSAFGDSALLIESVYFVLSPDFNTHADIQQRVFLAILRRFQAAGISFAFPTRSVVVKGDDGETRAVAAAAAGA